jgi:hypothetical protein
MKQDTEKQLEVVQACRKFYEDKFGYGILDSSFKIVEIQERYQEILDEETELLHALEVIATAQGLIRTNQTSVDAINKEIETLNELGFLFAKVDKESEEVDHAWESSAGSCRWYNEGEHGWNDSRCSGG